MKLGIISDIHGDIGNLEQAISLLEKKECRIVCLGDLVSEDSVDNDLCISLIRKSGITSVFGQHDDTCLKVNSPAVTAESRSFLESLPESVMIENFFLVHDNPLERARTGQGMWNQGSYIRSADQAATVFEDLDPSLTSCRFFLVGHTHVPKIFNSEIGETPFIFNKPLQLNETQKYIINPGRLGGADRNAAGATCGLLDTDNSLITIFRI